MVVAVEVGVVVVVAVSVVAKAMVMVEVEVVDLMTPTDLSFLKKNGMSLMVKEELVPQHDHQ
jgi:hypothetical protein